uniref:Uncharacterized protein n=1 Tax=Oryza barthii TaxID=65489 RepID=A0A0D3FSV6_9ORYZ
MATAPSPVPAARLRLRCHSRTWRRRKRKHERLTTSHAAPAWLQRHRRVLLPSVLLEDMPSRTQGHRMPV